MITEFRGEYRFLSNFWPSEVPHLDMIFPTVEHAFQAAKTINPIQRLMIQSAPTPGKAKQLGRTVTLKEHWDTQKIGVMYLLVVQKFTLHEELKQLLLDTGDEEIIEGNSWNDTFWGVCKGVGQNYLGKILMATREHIRKNQ